MLGPASKLNRDPAFLRALMDQGERQAEEFLAVLAFERAWRARDTGALLRILAEDVELTTTAPFRERASQRGEQARTLVTDLCPEVRIDLTREQLTQDGATWTVRVGGATDRRGRIEATVERGRVVRLRLGPEPG